MSSPDWLRTFLAIYRVGSVTEGARVRAVSQSAASQQLAALERAVGEPLFARAADGMVPTQRGRALFGEVAAALDQLEGVLRGLDAGRVGPPAAVRFGSSAECFSAIVLPRVAGADLSLVAWFGDDRDLLDELDRGELDAVVTSAAPGRRSLSATAIAPKRFVLVAAPGHEGPGFFPSMDALGEWAADQHWVAYSLELPITRRFWQVHLRRPFAANLRLVAPDLRAVLGAVERGMGLSLLPDFVCADALAQGRVVEVHPVASLIPPETWHLCVREGEQGRPEVVELCRRLVPTAEG